MGGSGDRNRCEEVTSRASGECNQTPLMSMSHRTAPDFELPDQNGDPIKLSDFKGQTVVLYFYPRQTQCAASAKR
jgi:cytochrome oxidase Cu insertion factor (SCO1/SenC/PrrC family)